MDAGGVFRFDFGSDSEGGTGDGDTTMCAGDERKADTGMPGEAVAAAEALASATPVQGSVFMPSESLVATILSQRLATSKVAGSVDLRCVLEPPTVTGELAQVVAKTDVLPGVYEGGFKVWECAIDVLDFLATAGSTSDTTSAGAQPTTTAFPFKLGHGVTVLELGCGHGLPGVYCLKQGCRVVFQDRNVEVLRDVALSNALCNVGAATCRERARFVMGDWSCVGKCLRQPLFTPKHDRTAATAGATLQYDLIVTTETVYSPVYYDVLCELLMTQLREGGLAVIGGKRYYFGTGGGTESFAVALSKTGVLECTVARVFDDGKSNIREVLLVRRLPSPAQRPLHEQQGGVCRDNDVSMD